jgi:hypothetical protein
VTAVATKLQASRTAEEGLWKLITEPASIHVTYEGQTEARLRWDLDLRERKYATGFLNALKDLGSILKNRNELQNAWLRKKRPWQHSVPSQSRNRDGKGDTFIITSATPVTLSRLETR